MKKDRNLCSLTRLQVNSLPEIQQTKSIIYFVINENNSGEIFQIKEINHEL